MSAKGVSPRGVSAWGMYTPVDRMTDSCKNITLPQNSFTGNNKSASNIAVESSINVMNGIVYITKSFLLSLM